MKNMIYDAYKNKIPENDRQCTAQLAQEWEKSKPLVGKKVLLNCHITLSTLIIVDILQRAGAIEIDITATSDLVAHSNPVSTIKEAGLNYFEKGNIPVDKCNKYYDIVFDCGAGLLNKVTPQIGMVELTHTDPNLYKDIKFPVITVDNSETKKLETKYGTGDGLVRTLIYAAKNKITYSCNSITSFIKENKCNLDVLITIIQQITEQGKLFQDRKYMLFGYGKVGIGIASALKSAGVKPKDIYVVEVSSPAKKAADLKGYTTLLLNKEDKDSLQKIKDHLPNMYGLITATGVENMMAEYFTPDEIKHIPYIANMGTPDEFGKKFSDIAILNDRKLANFMLEYPTEVMYLDPIFTILLKAGDQLVTDKKLVTGLQNVATAIDTEVLGGWKSFHKETPWKHAEYKLKTNTLLGNLSLFSPPKMKPKESPNKDSEFTAKKLTSDQLPEIIC